MAEQEARDAFAVEMARRFEEFVSWSIANWPAPASPLMESDFAACRTELQGLLGKRLDEAEVGEAADPAAGGAQYVNSNPAPWP